MTANRDRIIEELLRFHREVPDVDERIDVLADFIEEVQDDASPTLAFERVKSDLFAIAVYDALITADSEIIPPTLQSGETLSSKHVAKIASLVAGYLLDGHNIFEKA